MTDNSQVERDPETLALFIEESLEGMQRIEGLMLEAEKGRPAPDLMATVFRDIHTIKGTSAFLSLKKITGLAHVAENLLSLLRDKTLIARPEHFTLLLSVCDLLRRMVDSVRAGNEEGAVDVEPLIAQLIASMPSKEPQPSIPPPAPAPAVPEPPKLGEILVESKVITPAQLEEGLQAQKAAVAAAHHDTAESTIRVNVVVLDRLVNLIGELVLARNQLVQLVKVSRDSNANTQGACQRLNLVTSDLQEQIMKTRMQPIERVFEKIPRMVRDLSKTMGKQVITQIDGTSTEIDKALVEAIRDPVMHIIRNAMDHGIESPEARAAAGKPLAGKLSVRAAHQGGMVTIEIEDDGKGMDPKILRAHAVKRNVLTQADADRLSDREALELVFRPGFSTAPAVTDISGRGVGMDVVRTHIERAGGQAELDSTIGKGTIIRLKMPLTLAIIPALLVRTGQQRFAIPQVNLLELVYLNEEQSRTAIENVRGAVIHRLRGEVLPLVRLSEVLGLAPAAQTTHSENGTNIVVVAVGARRYGLVVDAIHDVEEIVIKPLHGQLKRLACYSGATVLGDGDVALILEVGGLAMKAGIDMSTQRQAFELAPVTSTQADKQAYVIFTAGSGAQCAVPLAVVARLENVARDSIETVAGMEVVQYRGTIMPIIRPNSVLPIGQPVPRGKDQLLLVFDFGQRVGMAVEEILDIVDVAQDPEGPQTDDPLILGQAVVAGRTTLILDVYQLVRKLAPAFVQERRRSGQRLRIMLVDDSTAMRAALSGFLRTRGYDVVDAVNGEVALREILSPKSGRFDAVVTDLEMDGLDGFGLISALQTERPKLPVIAWTFHEDPGVGARAIAAGARACVNKLRREDLMAALKENGVVSKRGVDAGRAA